MSTDKPIPERYALDWKTLQEHPVPSETWGWDKERHVAMGNFAKKLLGELGTAESLVRELAQVVESTRNAIPKLRISDKQSLVIYLSAALARIPKELLP